MPYTPSAPGWIFSLFSLFKIIKLANFSGTTFFKSSKETLNAVLDSSNNRLQVAMAGGTISGDVTINGDLTVNGDGSGTYDEIVNGNLHAIGDDQHLFQRNT